jgi:hypothetical protein
VREVRSDSVTSRPALVAVALTLDERDLVLRALRDRSRGARLIERERVEAVADLFSRALPVDDVAVRVALLAEVDG